ncbi:MAG: TerC family protein, partial [Propionibacteriales bacterium]|nr:TerC family protein [Propionibacteriales bacterium]
HVGWAPEIPIWLSLLFIVGTLAITAVASLLYSRSKSVQQLDDATGPRRDWEND